MIHGDVKMLSTPVPLPCGCVLSSTGIAFCAEAKSLWARAEELSLRARQAESAGAWKTYNDACAAYKNHFERRQS